MNYKLKNFIRMARIKNLAALEELKSKLQKQKRSYQDPDSNEAMVEIKVGMGTSGLASGARDIYDFLNDALKKRNIISKVTQVGDMGYSYAEPTIEVTLPGEEPVVFGNVDVNKADLIIEQYIRNKELVDGVIPVNYQTVDE